MDGIVAASSDHVAGGSTDVREIFQSEVIRNLPAPYYTCDSEGNITSYNKLAAELWGREPQIGKDKWCGSWRLYHRDGSALSHELCPMAIALKKGRPVTGEEIIVETPDGKRFHVLPYPQPVYNNDGVLCGAFNILVDITPLKIAEQKIRENEKFLQKIIDSSHDCIIVLDLQGRLISISEAAKYMTAITDINTIAGTSYCDLWEAQYRDAARRAVEAARKGGSGKFTGSFSSHITKAPGWRHVVITPILDNEGKPERLLSISRDMTEQRMLEEKLSEKNKTLEILNKVGKTISAELVLKDVALAVTDAATRISGAEYGCFFYDPELSEEPAFISSAIAGPATSRPAITSSAIKPQEMLKLFYKYGIIRSEDITTDKRYGDEIRFSGVSAYQQEIRSLLAVPVTSRTGEVIGALYLGHSRPSAFQRKDEDNVVCIASQAAIAIDNSRLFQASKADKEKLAAINMELNKKNEELQKINVDLDNFIYTASHDLKAPISNIEGLIRTLSVMLNEEETPGNDINGVLDMMKFSICRLSNTILDLTTITRIQKDTEDGESEAVSLQEVVEDVKLTCEDLIRSSGVRIVTDFSPCDTINFSRRNLTSIMYNLISNAIKYRSPDRSPEVWVFTEKTEGYVVLNVKDNGLGLDEYKQGKLFSMFKRFHNHVEGTGIGLYLVKRIITNAGGSIKAESTPGKGSTFKVYFKQ